MNPGSIYIITFFIVIVICIIQQIKIDRLSDRVKKLENKK
jgi:hypothetical protein